MQKLNGKSRAAWFGKLSALTLALAAIIPLPAALSPLSGVTEAHAQATNPCAPTRPAKARPANPCAPQKARPANPCAPQKKVRPANPCAPTPAVPEAAQTQQDETDCNGPVNPCAPVPDCPRDEQD